MQDQILTLAEAAEQRKVSTDTLRRYIATGKLRAYRAGRAIRIKASDLDALFVATR